MRPVKPFYDLCVIGGGINGTGIARDAAGRGLSVLLVEQGDLAGATSWASTKLIHGGLRYLEHGAVRLVAESLKERERLLKAAPHIVRPLEFILPHEKHIRPRWMIGLGLFLYGRLGGGGGSALPRPRSVNLKTDPRGAPLRDFYKNGFSYADCRVQDARLVILNAMDAAARGADIYVRTACTGLKPAGDHWMLRFKSRDGGKEFEASARVAVNAAGPWVRTLLDRHHLASSATPRVRLVKGSHIIVPRFYEGEQAYILQQPDRRVVFAIPYEERFTLIGTTEEPYEGDPAEAKISDEETDYLLAAIARSFENAPGRAAIVSDYSGVRPLLDQGGGALSTITRDYRLDLDETHGPALLNIFGGKLTTYRSLAERAVDKIASRFPQAGPPWTADAILPGGDIPGGDGAAFARESVRRYPQYPPAMIRRYAESYGTRLHHILKDAATPRDLGSHYGDDVYEAEIRYLVAQEWARAMEDILWRRSKLGLHVSPQTVAAIEAALPGILAQEGLDHD